MSIIVGRHPEGITINPLEFLLEDNGDLMEFSDRDEAKSFLSSKGLTDLTGIFLMKKDGEDG